MQSSESQAPTTRDRLVRSDPRLSPREIEILGLAADGLTDQQIAVETSLSVNSVATYVGTAARKAGATGRDQVVEWAAGHGLGSGTPPVLSDQVGDEDQDDANPAPSHPE